MPEPRDTAENSGLVYVPGEKCPLSGHVISFPDADDWVNEVGTCFGCGGTTRLKVRATDLFPRARALTHKVPRIPPGQAES